MGYVMVAALIVSSIGTCFAPEHRALSPTRTLRPKRKFAKGDELGYFNLGSSVVLLWEKPGMVPLVPKGDELQVGQLLYIKLLSLLRQRLGIYKREADYLKPKFRIRVRGGRIIARWVHSRPIIPASTVLNRGHRTQK